MVQPFVDDSTDGIDRNRADANIAEYFRSSPALPVGCVGFYGKGERTSVNADSSGIGQAEGYHRGTRINNDRIGVPLIVAVS